MEASFLVGLLALALLVSVAALVLAAAWIAAEGMDEEQAVALLEERDAKAFSFSDDEVRWRKRRLSGATLKAARGRFALSFGSCSIAEPVRALKSIVSSRSRGNSKTARRVPSLVTPF